MSKSTAYKRKLRRLQKAKKRRLARAVTYQPESADSQPKLDKMSSESSFETSTNGTLSFAFGSPGSPPPTPPSSIGQTKSFPNEDSRADQVVDVHKLGIKIVEDSSRADQVLCVQKPRIQAKVVTDLKNKLSQANKLIHLYEWKQDIIEEECRRQVSSVRSFWKDMIYHELSRGGKMVKKSMQIEYSKYR